MIWRMTLCLLVAVLAGHPIRGQTGVVPSTQATFPNDAEDFLVLPVLAPRPSDRTSAGQTLCEPKPQPVLLPAPIAFNPLHAELEYGAEGWRLVSHGRLIKEFGTDESLAQQCSDIIRDFKLTQRGVIGTPRPVIEYWLSRDRAPRGEISGLRSHLFERKDLRIEQIRGQWCLHDSLNLLFNFGSSSEEAQQALAVINRYGFNEVVYVGGATPVMILFLVGEGEPESGSDDGGPPASETTVRLGPNEVISPVELKTTRPPKPTSEADELRQTARLQGRQLNRVNPLDGVRSPGKAAASSSLRD